VLDAEPQNVRVPALIVANRDQCKVAPPDLAPKIAAAMSQDTDVKVVMVTGGISKSPKDCGSLTPHGYYGIEDRVVSLISDRVQSQLH
jgi:hypothetical protein